MTAFVRKAGSRILRMFQGPSAPAPEVDKVLGYSLDLGGDAQLFAIDPGGRISQITPAPRLATPGVSLAATIAAYPGETIELLPGNHVLDASVVSSAETLRFRRGAVITVPVSRTLGSNLDFSEGGEIQPANGITVSLTGVIFIPSSHPAFDASAGGSFSISPLGVASLSPYNFDGDLDAWAETLSLSTAAITGSSGILFGMPPGSIIDFDAIQAAIVGQLASTRRGIGGLVGLLKASVAGNVRILVESSSGQRLVGMGQWATEIQWEVGAPGGVPIICGNMVRALEVSEIGITALAPAAAMIQFQDDTIANPGPQYAANQRTTQCLIRRVQLSCTGFAQYGIYFKLMTQGGGKNDHHLVEGPTVDGFLHTGICIEGQASTAHLLIKPNVRSAIGAGGVRGLYGYRTGILPTDLRLQTNAFEITPDHTTDSFTRTAHGLETGTPLLYLYTTGSLPTGLALLTQYWAIKIDADTFQLAASIDDALAGTAVPFSTNGAGVLTIGGNWSSIDGKGGILKVLGGESTDNDIADFYIDSRNGCTAIYAMTMEGSARFLMAPSPSPSVSLNTVVADACKWTSNTDLAQDGEAVRFMAQGPLAIRNSQFGLATAPKELKFYFFSPRDYAGFVMPANEVSSPYAHGHFSGFYPDDGAVGSLCFDADGNVTPLLYMYDGPDRIVPYTVEHWQQINHETPDQWFACQEARGTVVVAAVTPATDTFTKTEHGLSTCDGPLQPLTTGTLPTGMVQAGEYYAIRLTDSTFKLADSFDHAAQGVPIDVTTAGTGTLSLELKDRNSVYSLVKGQPRHDLILRAAAPSLEPDDFPILQVRRSVEADTWQGYWVQFTGKVGQVLSFNDMDLYIQPDLFSVAMDLVVDITGKSVLGMLCALGAGGNPGLWIRVTTAGKLSVQCGANNAVGTVDYTTKGPTLIRFIYDKYRKVCLVITPYEQIPVTYAETVNHTQHIGIGSTSGTLESFTGFLRHAALWIKSKAERLGTDITRRGWGTASSQVTSLFPTGGLNGLSLSRNDVRKVGVSAGGCRDGADTGDITTPALEVNLEAAGAGGLDTGAIAASTHYAIWLISDSTMTNLPSAIASASFSAPTMPTGYNRKRFLGSVRTDGASNLLHWNMFGTDRLKHVEYDEDLATLIALNAGNQLAFTDVDLSALVPPRGPLALGLPRVHLLAGFMAPVAGAATDALSLRPNGSAADGRQFSPGVILTSQQKFEVNNMPADANRVIEYKVTDADDTASLWVLGYDVEL